MTEREMLKEVRDDLESYIFYLDRRKERAEIATKLDVADVYESTLENVEELKTRIDKFLNE